VTPFILVCAVMIIAAVAILAVPLVRRVPPPAKGTPAAPRATLALVVTAIAVPLAAVAFYSGVSNFPWQNPQAANAASGGHEQGGGAESLSTAAKQLEERLAANPQDAEGWRMLGRTYLVTGEAGKAVAAYEKADALLGGQDAGLKLDIAEALVLTDDPAAQGRAKEIIDAALKSDPSNGKALWYAGVMAMRVGDKETAQTSFQKLLEQNPPQEIRDIVVQQLAALGVQTPASVGADTPGTGSRMGGSMGAGTATPAADGAATPTGRTIRISISLDPTLAGKMKPGTPLFVAARQPGIPGPPLAAQRLSSDQLPMTVVLSDANSMIEGRNLSSVDDVEVVARVAFGGTAVPAPGDLVGTAQSRKGGPTDLTIVINKVAP
jgi:cytochrome c-type biogenesis protein CcmH